VPSPEPDVLLVELAAPARRPLRIEERLDVRQLLPDPAPKRLLDRKEVALPAVHREGLLVATRNEVVQTAGPAGLLVLRVQAAWAVRKLGKLMHSRRIGRREEDPRERRLMDEDRVALVFLVEGLKGRRLAELEEPPRPGAQEPLLRADDETAGVDVRPDLRALDAVLYGKQGLLGRAADAVERAPKGVRGLVEARPGVRDLGRTIAKVDLWTRQEAPGSLKTCVSGSIQKRTDAFPRTCPSTTAAKTFAAKGKSSASVSR